MLVHIGFIIDPPPKLRIQLPDLKDTYLVSVKTSSFLHLDFF